MKPTIDLICPNCAAQPGAPCFNPVMGAPIGLAITLDYHHAARVDAAFDAVIDVIMRTRDMLERKL